MEAATERGMGVEEEKEEGEVELSAEDVAKYEKLKETARAKTAKLRMDLDDVRDAHRYCAQGGGGCCILCLPTDLVCPYVTALFPD